MSAPDGKLARTKLRAGGGACMIQLSHLQKLEAEAIFIIREVVATCDKPVLLYSIGKDSAVLLHLAMKAFYPAKPPFPLLHVDTTWKFREMIELSRRDGRAARARPDRPRQPGRVCRPASAPSPRARASIPT